MEDGQPFAIVRAVEEVILGAQSGQVMAAVDRDGKGILGRTVCDIGNGVRTYC
jgi:hypothetical protein